jgi:hypothetical protein
MTGVVRSRRNRDAVNDDLVACPYVGFRVVKVQLCFRRHSPATSNATLLILSSRLQTSFGRPEIFRPKRDAMIKRRLEQQISDGRVLDP